MPVFRHIHVCLAVSLWLLNITGVESFAQGRKSAADGKKIAVQYCGTCHQFPEATLLDRQTWIQSVLPKMGWRLGMRRPGEDPFADLTVEEAQRVRQAGVYPSKPLLTTSDWQQIQDYFTQHAPEALQVPEDPVGAQPLDRGFEVLPLTIGEKAVPRTSMLRFDTANQWLYIGDAAGELSILDGQYTMQGYWQLTAPPADIVFRDAAAPLLLSIGSIAPTEKREGVLFALDSIGRQTGPTRPLTGLARPVHVTLAELDGKGKNDLLVCEFGHHTGSLSLYTDGNPSQKRILSGTPGARRTIVSDVNGDGRPDVFALMAQSDERLSLFLNLGNGRFQEKVLLRFPPLHGLSHFELADFNSDGQLDILMTNGDNWDYSAVRKPYHGIRIFLNKGGLRFEEAWFQSYYGASKAMAVDLDADGDLDIAAISFYDDPLDPARGFLYLENTGHMHFRPWQVPAAGNGKWLTMEVCDLDGDRKMDIVLGSYFHTAAEVARLTQKGVTEFPQVLVLLNRLAQRAGVAPIQKP